MYTHFNKLLWLIGFSLWGCQIISLVEAAAAEALPSCPSTFTSTSCSDTSAANYYCTKDDVIYELETSEATDCISKIDSSINIFEVSKSGSVYTISKVNLAATVGIAANLVIYSCDGSKCTRTYGYIKDSTDYYSVGTSASSKLSDSNIVSSCTEGNIGKLYKDANASNAIKLCLAAEIGTQSITTSSSKKYVMINKASNIFTGGASNTDKYIGISANENAIIYYAIADESYSVVSTTYENIGTSTASASNATWDTLYTCSGGLCSGETYCNLKNGSTFTGCSEGYYITSAASVTTLSTAAAAGDLYQCTNNGSLSCAKVDDDDDIPVGYLFNNDPISESTLPFIKCTATTSGGSTTKSCTSMAVDSTACGTGSGKAGTGELIKVTSPSLKYSICLDSAASTPVSVELSSSSTSTVNYFISISGSGNIFGTASDSYAIISSDKQGVYLPTTSGTDGYYITSAVNAASLSTAEGAGDLYKCTTDDSFVCTKVANGDILVGYLFNSDSVSQDTLPFIKCTASTSGGSTTKSCTSVKVEKTECGTGTGKAGTGELIKVTAGEPAVTTYSLCLDSTASSPISVELNISDTTIDNYIISIGGSGNAFGSASDSYTVIDNDEEGIHLPATSTAGYYIFDKDTYKLLAAAGEGLLFNCSETGTCTAVDQVGFYKNVDDTVTHTKCSMDTSGEEATLKCEGLTTSSDTCDSAANSGKIVTSSLTLCLDGSKTATFVATGNDPIQYLLNYGADSIFNTVIAENTYGIIKATEDSMTLDTTVTSNKEVCADVDQKVTDLPESGSCAATSTLYSLCTSGICQKICKVKTGVNCENGNYYLVSDADTSAPITDTTATGHVYYCSTAAGATDPTCEEKTAKGYYVNDKTSAFSCTGEEGVCKKETVETACTADTIGKLFEDSDDSTTNTGICLNYKGSAAIKSTLSGNDGTYLMTPLTNNHMSIPDGKMGLITIANKSIVLNTSNGNCIESKDDPNTLAGDGDEGILYSCEGGYCTAVVEDSIKIGYYRNIGSSAVGTADYIKCDSTKKCEGLDAESATDCSGKAVGDLIYETTTANGASVTTYKLCIETTTPLSPIDLGKEGTNNGQYFIDVGGTIVFGTKASSYAIIRITGENVFLEGKETGINRYRYGDTTTQKLFKDNEYDSSKCMGTPPTTTVLEFKLNDGSAEDLTDYYTKQQ